MSLTLYTSWISTFARKAALGLELKGLSYVAVDALSRSFRPKLLALNPRAEVPVLDDAGLVVIDSSDILQYLEWRYPEPPLYPAAIEDRVAARALERLADRRLDPIVVDTSLWLWAERDDQPPPGLRADGQHDLKRVLEQLELELGRRSKPWPFGAPGIVECAWFPNLAAAKPLGFEIPESRFGNVLGWLAAMRGHPVFAADRRRTAQFVKQLASSDYERIRVFWSGERIEWLLSRGYLEWFADEVKHGRVSFPHT